MHGTRQTTTGIVFGVLFGVGLTFCFGAQKAATSASPRYSVQYAGRVMLITDNETNKLFTYENTGESSQLRTVVDLTSTGQQKLAGYKSNGQGEPDKGD